MLSIYTSHDEFVNQLDLIISQYMHEMYELNQNMTSYPITTYNKLPKIKKKLRWVERQLNS